MEKAPPRARTDENLAMRPDHTRFEVHHPWTMQLRSGKTLKHRQHSRANGLRHPWQQGRTTQVCNLEEHNAMCVVVCREMARPGRCHRRQSKWLRGRRTKSVRWTRIREKNGFPTILEQRCRATAGLVNWCTLHHLARVRRVHASERNTWNGASVTRSG